MIELNNSDFLSIQRELAIKLVNFSKSALTPLEAEQISVIVMTNFDFGNSSLTHKGINWLAKEIISIIDFSIGK